MSNEKDPHLGDIGDIDVDSSPTGRTTPGSTAGRRPPPKQGGQAPRKPAPAPKGGQGPWMPLSLALLALVLVVGAYFYREISTLQARLDNRLEESTQKLGNLESQLSATDESLSQSANTIEDRLQLHMDEIRKLWDVSNKRNKGWIEENQRDIKALESSRSKLDKTVSQLDSQLTGLRQQLESAGDARGRMQTRLDLVTETVQQLEDDLGAQRKALKQLEGMQKEWQAMTARMKDMEAAIDAFDAWRRQVNNRLQQLEGGQGGA